MGQATSEMLNHRMKPLVQSLRTNRLVPAQYKQKTIIIRNSRRIEARPSLTRSYSILVTRLFTGFDAIYSMYTYYVLVLRMRNTREINKYETNLG